MSCGACSATFGVGKVPERRQCLSAWRRKLPTSRLKAAHNQSEDCQIVVEKSDRTNTC